MSDRVRLAVYVATILIGFFGALMLWIRLVGHPEGFAVLTGLLLWAYGLGYQHGST